MPADPTEKEEVYRVWFDDPQGSRRFVDIPRFRGISYVREGFWVTEDFSAIVAGLVPHGGNWIPPGRVVCVTKLDLEPVT